LSYMAPGGKMRCLRAIYTTVLPGLSQGCLKAAFFTTHQGKVLNALHRYADRRKARRAFAPDEEPLFINFPV